MVVSNIFLFSPRFGQMIQFDEHIFQMGWFNHQLDEGHSIFKDKNPYMSRDQLTLVVYKGLFLGKMTSCPCYMGIVS